MNLAIYRVDWHVNQWVDGAIVRINNGGIVWNNQGNFHEISFHYRLQTAPGRTSVKIVVGCQEYHSLIFKLVSNNGFVLLLASSVFRLVF